jgi:hypothetical protein
MLITDNGLAYMASLPLHSLDINHCHEITDAGLERLSCVRSLHTLDISGCSFITGNGLKRLSYIHTLDISGCDTILYGGGLVHLSTLQKLVHLKIGKKYTRNRIRDLKHLSSLKLHTLDMSGCKVYNAQLSHLSSMPLLHTLNISDCWNITDTGLEYLSSLPLHNLDISGCDKITDAGLSHLSQLHLSTLDLRGCTQITDAGMSMLLCISNLKSPHDYDEKRQQIETAFRKKWCEKN